MARSARQAHSSSPSGESALTGRLRFEIADEEERALLGSCAISSSLGLAFLLLVQFGPRMPVVPIESRTFGPVVVGPLSWGGAPEPILGGLGRNGGGRKPRVAGAASRPATGSISNAFAAGATVASPTNILGAVAITPAGGASAGTGGKAVLAYGEDGPGSVTPGRGGIAAGGGGSSEIGGVARGGNVARSASQVAAPPVVSVDPLPPQGDVASVATHVRGNESQLRFCYQEIGLAANPALAGSITVAITVAANGSVAGASVTKRSWSGAGAAESEACVLRSIRGWRLPATGRAQTTYSFPFNFSR